jgi:hypothetical protein
MGNCCLTGLCLSQLPDNSEFIIKNENTIFMPNFDHILLTIYDLFLKMTDKLSNLIEEIIQYGLDSNYCSKKHLNALKKKLMELLLFYMDNEFLSDDGGYPDFERNNYSYIKENLRLNFPDIGHYKYFTDISDLTNFQDFKTQDVIDDINDIMLDLLEVKYRLENNGHYAGTDTFEFLYELGMKQKTLNVINYIYQMK